MKQLKKLATPFPAPLISQKPGRGDDYVKHSVVRQALLANLGPYSTRVEHIITDPDGTLTGVILRLSVVVDGERVEVEEAGEADNASSLTNGARMKDAMSDAIKRCAMALGLGLHLWAGDQYFLYDVLKRREEGRNE